jgi:hypothetical protein
MMRLPRHAAQHARPRIEAFMTRLALVGLIAVLVAVNLVCVFLDQTPYLQDSGRYLILSHCWFEAFAGRQSFLACHLVRTDQKPDIWLALGALAQHAFFATGRQDAVIVAEQIFLALLLLGVYVVARQLAPNERPAVALFAVFVTGVSPVVFGLSKKYMGDLPLAAAIWAALAVLLATDRFRRPWRSVAFGASCGAGLLMRPTFALFLAGPAALTMAAAWRDKSGRGPALRHAACAAAAAIAIAAPWYLRNFRGSYRHYAAFGENLPTAFGCTAGRYLRLIAAEQLGWVFAALLVAGLVRLLASAELRAKYGALLAAGFGSMAIPFFYLGSARVAFARYAIGWVPWLAIVLALGLSAEGGAAVRLRRAIVGLAVAFGAFQFACLSFSTAPWRPDPPVLERVLGFPDFSHYPGDTHVGLFRIDRRGWSDREFCRVADELRPGLVRVLLLTDFPCRDAIAFQAIKWCLVFDESESQMVRTDVAGPRLAEMADAAQRWPQLTLLAYADESRLAQAVATLGLENGGRFQRVFRRPSADGFVALYRNSAPDPDAPAPPTVAGAGECVAFDKCREWCVKTAGAAAEKN